MSLQRMFTAAMAGVVVGLLIAPAKGSETRQKIADSADQIKDRIRRMRGATNQELDELHEVFEHEIQGLRDDIREKVLKLIDLSKKSYNHIKAEAMS